jgi:tRNA-uridine aminocarboxypropyltransferase
MSLNVIEIRACSAGNRPLDFQRRPRPSMMLCSKASKPLPGEVFDLTRQRKVRDPCPICAVSRPLCLCDAVPRIELKTKIALVIHHRELSRNSNTGLLALRALVNSEVRIRGEGREALDLQGLLSPQYRTFLFFPCADAVELDRTLVMQDRRPIQLIVPDGTWRQARKILFRHPELKDLPRVKIGAPNHSTFQLRAQSRPERMATLQAIAHGLGVIEGDPVRAQLMTLYDRKIERTLLGRGILREKSTFTTNP